MTIDEAKTLKVGDAVAVPLLDDAPGDVTAATDAGVTIKWRDGLEATYKFPEWLIRRLVRV